MIPYNEEIDWYFTFGSDHKHSKGYVKIFGTFDGARNTMLRRYKWAWTFQNTLADVEEEILICNLQEIKEDWNDR